MAKAPPPLAEAAASLVQGASIKSDKYSSRSQAAAGAWFTAASAAGQAYSSAVTAPSARQLFESKIRSAGAGAYAGGVSAKGRDRYAPGVQAGSDKYQRNTAAAFRTITATALPTRGLRGSPGNIERVRVLANALHALRVGSSAAGA